VARILHSGEESTTATLLRDVYRLPAGHSLTIRRGRPVAAVRWWHTLDHLPRPPSGAAAQTERFLELLGSAVDLRLSGNAKIAIPLSGGMDSSAILALACEHRQRLPDIAAFFIRKSGVLDEEKFAMSMAAHAGIAPVVIAGSAELSVAMLEARALACESFTLGSEGPMALYRAVRDSGAKVTLDGHGGDELLGGYPRYLEPAIDDALGGMPDPLRLLQLAAINRGLAAGSESLTLFKGWENTRQRLRAGWRRRWADPADPAATGAAQAPPGFDGLNSALYHDVHHGFLQKILRTFDYSSMAYGVEARTPFLDWRLVTYAFALPSTAKIGARHTKSILRKAMRGRMPDDVLYRRSKVGFIEANRYFLNPAVVDWIGDQLADAACQQSALWDGRQIAAAYARWRQGPRNAAVGRRLLTVAQAHFVLGRICAGQAAGQAAGALADVA
jgi:asparagine synthase (glutamine-hydrolysing)